MNGNRQLIQGWVGCLFCISGNAENSLVHKKTRMCEYLVCKTKFRMPRGNLLLKFSRESKNPYPHCNFPLFCIYLEYEWIDAAAMCWAFCLP